MIVPDILNSVTLGLLRGWLIGEGGRGGEGREEQKGLRIEIEKGEEEREDLEDEGKFYFKLLPNMVMTRGFALVVVSLNS